MASPISPNSGQPLSFHTNVNRAKTKRWVEAKTYNYDGDEWGGGDEYEDEYHTPAPEPDPRLQQHAQPTVQHQSSIPNQPYPPRRYGDLPQRHPGQFAGRVVTNSASSPRGGHPHFDSPQQANDRRAFSAGTEPFDRAYPTSQRPPFSPSQSYSSDVNSEPRMAQHRVHSGQSSPQPGRRPSMEPGYFSSTPPMSDHRSSPYADSTSLQYPRPLPSQDRRSQSSGRPSREEIYSSSRESPGRMPPSSFPTSSHGSREASPPKPLPPRKSSLSHQTAVSDLRQSSAWRGEYDVKEVEQIAESSAEAKPLPFVRPADIYRRVAEEKERERTASEESSRRSVADDDGGASQQTSRSALDPVAERRSEYGMDHSMKESGPMTASAAGTDVAGTAEGVSASRSIEGEHALSDDSPQHGASTSQGQENVDHELESRGSPEGQATVTDVPSSHADQQPLPDARPLHHNPSAGFTSVVHQAFEDSQSKVPPTPSSAGGNSLLRSGSDSPSEISPIMNTESGDIERLPTSTPTAQTHEAGASPTSDSDPLPPPIKPGFRRDSRTPSPGNSPARRRPQSIVTTDFPPGELGVLSTTSTPIAAKPDDDLPTTIPRAESPTKGTVRDLAGRIEHRSPASSPERGSLLAVDAPRPSNSRLESFRPSLPGGWVSYSTSAAPSPTRATTPLQSTDQHSTDTPPASEPTEEDTPTAGPPKPRAEGYETSNKAFEALAAAGTALSGAFSTMTGTRHDDSGEDMSTADSSTRDVSPAQEYPGGLSPVQEVLSPTLSVPPTPVAKDGIHLQKTPPSGYFPSPLRPSKSSEPSVPARPPMLPALSTDISPQDTESDRLRKEIFRSLTPKTTNEDREQSRDGHELDLALQQTSSTAHRLPTEEQEGVPQQEGAGLVNETSRDEMMSTGDAPPSTPDLAAGDSGKESHRHDGSTTPNLTTVGSERPFIQQKFSWETPKESMWVDSKSPASTTLSSPWPYMTDNVADSPASSSHAPYSLTDDNSKPLESSHARNRSTISAITKSTENVHGEVPSPVAKDADGFRVSMKSQAGRQSFVSPHSRSASVGELLSPSRESGQARTDAPPPSAPRTTGAVTPFRDILSMNTPQERIRAYDSTRQQLASEDSGLANWLQATGSQHSEHLDLLNRNGRLSGQDRDSSYRHKASPSKSKLPWIGGSFGSGGGNPHPHPHGDASDGNKADSGSPSSGKLGSQQMQEEGKKLLQSAGKIGGKAGGAAKGLFARGKNRLRASSGGGDKALESSRSISSRPGAAWEEEAPLSRTTAVMVPQISPIFSSVQSSSDTWSLPYAPAIRAGRTVDAAERRDVDTPVEPTTKPGRVSLSRLGYDTCDDALQRENALPSPSVPSPQISALSSTHQDGVPSRSVSEVTRPDDPLQHASWGRSSVHKEIGQVADARDDVVRPSSSDGSTQPASRSPSPRTPELSRAGAYEDESPSDLLENTDDILGSASSGSHYSQPTPEHILSAPWREIRSWREDEAVRHDWGEESSVERPISAVSSVSERGSGLGALQDDGTFQSSSTLNELPQEPVPAAASATEVAAAAAATAGQNLPAKLEFEQSSPHQEDVPRYSAVVNSQEIETDAADEKSYLSENQENRQSLPAYQSPTREHSPRLSFPSSAIVRVKDLSSRRHEENFRPSSRPFSFVRSAHGDVLHQYTAPEDGRPTFAVSSSVSDGIDHRLAKTDRHILSGASNDAKIAQHPAFRGNDHGSLPRQNRDHAPKPAVYETSRLNVQPRVEEEGGFPIPGPYGQHLKLPKSSKRGSSSLDPEKHWPQQPPHSAPLVGPDGARGQGGMAHPRPRSSESPARPAWSIREPPSLGRGDDTSVSPPIPAPQPVNTAARSRSRSRRPRDHAAGLDESSNEARTDERRVNPPRGYGHHQPLVGNAVLPDQANRSQSALGIYQPPSPHQEDPRYMPDGMKVKAKEHKLHKKPKQQMPPPPLPSGPKDGESRVKGGIRLLGGLFNRSKGNASPSPPLPQQESVRRSSSAKVSSSAVRKMSPSMVGPAYHQQRQRDLRISPNRGDRGGRPPDHDFQGQSPPTSGYYGPKERTAGSFEHRVGSQPRDPDSFIGGQRLSEQRAAEQGRLLRNVSPADGRVSGEMRRPPARAMAPPTLPLPTPPSTAPHSAPPHIQHFNLARQGEEGIVEQQGSRYMSQRFPGLRIDTSGRGRPPKQKQRRNQPPPAVTTTSTPYHPKGPQSPQHGDRAAAPSLPSSNASSTSPSGSRNNSTPNVPRGIYNNNMGVPTITTSPMATTTTKITRPQPFPMLEPSYPPRPPRVPPGPRNNIVYSKSHSHVMDLHKRSRSPRDEYRHINININRDGNNLLPPPDGSGGINHQYPYSSSLSPTAAAAAVSASRQSLPLIDPNDPASRLGTFEETGGDGETGHGDRQGQEKPWMIDLPATRTASSSSITDTSSDETDDDDDGNDNGEAGDVVKNNRKPKDRRSRRRRGRGRNRTRSKHNDDNDNDDDDDDDDDDDGDDNDDDDKIIMCSTAYPGQEWMPPPPTPGSSLN